jgi:1,4-alpha-glucan branching enzyme
MITEIDCQISLGDGIIVAADFPWRINDFGLPAWNEMVIYQMHVGTFPDDPVAVGDMFTAIIQDMGYLKELGINVIQLLPTKEFPTDSSWGYNPTHVFAVESGYGDPEELKRFIDAAHENGLAVILDVVYNHFGPSDLEHSVWQFDGWFEHWDREEMGGIYFYNDWRAHTPRNGKRRLPDAIHPGSADSWHAKKRSTLGAALVLTSPGIPMIFQGQEVLEWTPFGDENRIDWEKYDTFRGIFTLYRDLIRLRRNWFDNTRGLRGQHVNVFHANKNDKLIAFHRWDHGGPGDDVVVVANFADRGYNSYHIGFPRLGRWDVRFNSDWSGYSPDFGNHHSYDTTADEGSVDGMPYHGNIGIGPYSAIILSQ